MISIDQAVKAARDFAKQLYVEGELKGLRVEEVEMEGGEWRITLGWVEHAVREGLAARMGMEADPIVVLPRVYKVFTVDSETGEVKSMRMRRNECAHQRQTN